MPRALVAQLDRVLASEAKGRGFDSRRARHFSQIGIQIRHQLIQTIIKGDGRG